MQWLALVILAGAVGAIQNAINPKLGSSLDNRALATLSSFATGTLCALTYCMVTRPRIPALSTFQSVPWWAWLGGVCGAIYVGAIIVSVPKLGVGTVVGLSITSSLVTSLLLDHFGWLGLNRQPINGMKIVGAILLIAGIWIITSASRSTPEPIDSSPHAPAFKGHSAQESSRS